MIAALEVCWNLPARPTTLSAMWLYTEVRRRFGARAWAAVLLPVIVGWFPAMTACSRSGFVTPDTADQGPTSATWWSTSWSNRRRLGLSSLGLSESFTDLPVLVILDSNRIDYTKTQNGGQDLRFVDADGVRILSHEIERWDESGTSYVWVKVPLIQGDTAGSIWLYYGNAAAPDGQNASDVWSNGYVMVHHLSEMSGNHHDSTAYHNDSSTVSVTTQGSAPGKIAGADEIRRASSDSIWVQPSASLGLVDELTVSVWIASDFGAPSGFQPVVAKGQTYHGWNYWLGTVSDSVAFLYANPTGTYFTYAGPVGAVPAGQWHDIAATYSRSGTLGDLSVFVDGSVSASWSGIAPVLLANSEQLQIGGDTCPSNYDGFVDEIRISSVVRSVSWMAAEHFFSSDSQIQFGVEESP